MATDTKQDFAQSDPDQFANSRLSLRMTPEIMAELAFQQVNLIASRLTLTGQRDFYAKLQKYISEIQ